MTEATVAISEDFGIGRAFVKGSVVGFLAVFAVICGMSLVAGVGLGHAIVVGLFTAAWGGPGFGGMLGAVLRYTKNEGA